MPHTSEASELQENQKQAGIMEGSAEDQEKKLRASEYQRIYRKTNKEKLSNYFKEYDRLYRDKKKVSENARAKYTTEKRRQRYIKERIKKGKSGVIKLRIKKEITPWGNTLKRINARCHHPSHTSFKRYGAKGIKNLISLEELKELWERDRGDLMLWPSIDRIDPSGNYEFGNCRYLEHSENSRLGGKNRKKKER